MAVNLSPVGGVAAQFFTSTGAVLTGGKLYTYAAGTTTPQVTYTTSAGNVPWTNPVVLDAAGRVPGSGEIWLTDGLIYKFVLKDSNDVLIATYDNITGINSNAVAYTNQQDIQTATAGQTVFTLPISYQPATNSLSVFVDGVNQYGPGAQYSYVETDDTTVTFNAGLHVGASVKFTTTQQQGAGAVDAEQVSYQPPFTGSVATNVEAKLAQYVSVKDFGAVGNGGANDTAAIQAALDSGAKKIYAPAGTYNFTQILIRGNNIEFFGDGDSTILNATDNTKWCAIAFVENYSHIYVHDFQLQGGITSEPAGPSPFRGIVNGTNATGTAHSTLTWNAFNRIQRIHFTGTNPGTNGFNLCVQNNMASYSTIQDCVFESIYGTAPSFGYGIVSNGLGHQILYNRFLSTITGQGRHAVYMTDIPISQKVIGNYCKGFQNEAITSNCAPGAYDLSVINNTIIDCLLTDTGTSAGNIDILGAPRSKVIGNTIKGSNRAGITISGTSPSCIVADNTIQNTVAWGIYCVDNSDNTQIVNNLIDAPDYGGTNTYGGIEIATSKYVFVSGNRIGGTNYRYGIRFNSSSPVPTYCQVFDNNITGTYSYEIENGSQSLTNSIRQIISQPKQLQYTTGATTINVSQNVRTVFGIQNGSPTAITALTGAYPGQIVTLVFFDTVTSVSAGALITLSGGSFTATNKSSLTLAYYNDVAGWYEIGRTTNVT